MQLQAGLLEAQQAFGSAAINFKSKIIEKVVDSPTPFYWWQWYGEKRWTIAKQHAIQISVSAPRRHKHSIENKRIEMSVRERGKKGSSSSSNNDDDDDAKRNETKLLKIFWDARSIVDQLLSRSYRFLDSHSTETWTRVQCKQAGMSTTACWLTWYKTTNLQ